MGLYNVVVHFTATGATDSVADLLRRISDKDSAAWDEIVRRYDKFVLAIVRSYRLQEADAHDAIQMTWLRLAENSDRVRLPDRLGGWLATTARCECLRILRQAKRVSGLTDLVSETVADPSAGPEQRAIDANVTQTLRTLIDELPPPRRTVIRMLFNDIPYSYEKVASIARIPLGGVGPTRTRALRQLRDKLDQKDLGTVLVEDRQIRRHECG